MRHFVCELYTSNKPILITTQLVPVMSVFIYRELDEFDAELYSYLGYKILSPGELPAGARIVTLETLDNAAI